MKRRDLQAGQIIDGFRLIEPLESGGMASFWRVTHDGDGSPMVMKIPLLRPGEDPLTIIGYEVEQMILPRLAGPHAPRFIAAGDFERPYIVMEFIAGALVKSLLARQPLPANEVAAIGARIAFALHNIHRQHVIHSWSCRERPKSISTASSPRRITLLGLRSRSRRAVRPRPAANPGPEQELDMTRHRR